MTYNKARLKSGIILSAIFFSAIATNAFAQNLNQSTNAPIDEKVLKIQKQIIIIDPHLDVSFNYGTGDLDPKIDGKSQFDIPKANRGNIGAVAIAAYVPQGELTPNGYNDAKIKLDSKLHILHDIAKNNPDKIQIAYSPSDVKAIHKKGKIAEIISFLNAYPLAEDVSQIDYLYKNGVRVFGFVHVGNNAFADSSRTSTSDTVHWDGLSPLGKQAVTKLNNLGILIDISQLSKSAALQVINQSNAPVIATHSGVQGVVINPRNLSDEELDALAKKGGVIAINAYKSYLKTVPQDKAGEVIALREKYGLSPQFTYPLEGYEILDSAKRIEFSHAINDLIPDADVSDLVNSIDYAVKRIGIDHVAISSDFNHGGGVIGWSNEGETINITAELVKRGYSEQEIAKIWGGNFLRVWQEAQNKAVK